MDRVRYDESSKTYTGSLYRGLWTGDGWIQNQFGTMYAMRQKASGRVPEFPPM